MTTGSNCRRNFFRVLVVAAFLLLPNFVRGQAATTTARTPGTPSGTYKLGEADSTNLFTGNLNYHLPLLEVGGRGEARSSLGVTLETQVDYREVPLQVPEGFLQHQYSFKRPNPLGFVGYMDFDVQAVQTGTPCGSGNYYIERHVSMVYVEADGTQHALRDNSTHGLPVNDCVTGRDIGQVFQSSSGDFITFTSDSHMYTDCYGVSGCTSTATGYLYFRNGVKSRVVGGKIMWTQDRNGNRIDYTYGDGYRVTQITDSLGRTIQIQYDVSESAPYGTCTRLVYKGFGAQDEIIRISTESDVSTLFRATQPQDSIRAQLESDDPNDNILLGGGNSDSWTFIRAIWLPNGQSYQFKYNILGQLARVDLPTGGAIEYDFADILQLPFAPAPSEIGPVTNQVSEKRLYGSGGSLLSRTKFTNPTSYTAGVVSGGTVRDIDVYDPSGNRLAKTRHYFYGIPNTNYGLIVPWWHGKELRSETFAANGTTMLRILESNWQQRTPSWGPPNSPQLAATNNPFVVETKSTLVDGNLVSKVSSINPADGSWAFDSYNNQTATWVYGYGAGQPGGLITRTQTSYMNYVNLAGGIYLLGLTDTTNVYGYNYASQEILESCSQTVYDEYGSYPLLTYGSVTGWQDPGSYRGNPTTVRRWIDTTGGWSETHAQFDQLGNPRNSWDALGNLNQTSYTDSFSDGLNRNTFAFATQATSPVPDTSGTYGTNTPLVNTNTYDFYSGLVTATTDPNSRTTTFDYTDPLNRLKQVNSPDGGQTTYTYVDAHQCGAYVLSQTLLDSSGRHAVSYQFFDGLGRGYRSFTYENQDTNNPYLTVDTQYDAMGRVYRTSSPYRSAGCGTAINPSGSWTETSYDTLSRPTQVTTSVDGASVTSSYTGNTVTVTDAGNKQRKSVSDALGRVTDVYEGSNDSNANYQTSYCYDARGNLRRVSQGSQVRSFMYDSLGRLVRAKYPEQAINANLNATDPVTGNGYWSSAYTYDNDGDLITRTDARNVITTYAYDALNRNYSVTYSDGTPAVYRYFDYSFNGRGRLYWQQSVGVAAGTIDSYDSMGRVTQYKQRFWVNGAWVDPYTVTRNYDYAGNVLGQTYPSGHTVSYNYDIAGRISNFSGTLGDGVSRTYSTNLLFSEFGGIQQEQFGTQTPVYDKRHYNPRGQMFDQRLSSYSWGASEWDWNRGAIVNYFSSNYSWGGSGTDNNGNIWAQSHYAPAGDGNYAVANDYYSYDALNRLSYDNGQSYSSTSGTWTNDYVQYYSYDQWGNRTVNPASWGNIPKPAYTIDAGTNRLVAPSGYSYGYDENGNQTYDSYTGEGSRTYDAENHLKTAWGNSQWQNYTYDFSGRRIKRVVNGNEVWQVYGISGELLGEYKVGAAEFLPSKEYGYRGGELLVTMASGDDNRLSRFVTNLYRGALQRDPTSGELQSGINSLGSAGATGGYSSLLNAASSLAYSLFAATNYEYNNGRSDTQFVADLYYSYLQRGPDDSGLNWWAGQVPNNGRYNTLLAFQYSGEFQTLVSTLYGTATSDNERTEHIVNNFYLGALGRDANSSELAGERDALNNAAAQGVGPVQTELENFARSIFAAQISDYSISDQQFVTNLYEGFLQRGPDAGGLGFWTSIAANGNRQNVLNAFAGATEFHEMGATLYREEFWLVHDRLGTPRMIVDKSGSLASVRRHDYLPFGEELPAGVGQLRTTSLGFVGDNTRQKFTGYEYDSETELDFAEARYHSSKQGRFTSVDPFMASASVANPQSFNRYSHALNNPMRFIDSSGMASEEHDDEISAAFAELNSLADWADAKRQTQADKAREDAKKQQQQQKTPPQQTTPQNNQQGNAPKTGPVNLTDSSVINQRIAEINKNATPLAPGEAPVPTNMEYIVGEQVQLQNATVNMPDGTSTSVPNGYMRTVAIIVTDQKGNIMNDPNLSVTEKVTPTDQTARDLEKMGRLNTSNNQPIDQAANGVFYDGQIRSMGTQTLHYETSQDVTIKSGRKGLWKIANPGNAIVTDDATRSITITKGKVNKFY